MATGPLVACTRGAVGLARQAVSRLGILSSLVALVFASSAPARGAAPADESPPSSRIQPGLLHLRPTELAIELEGSYERRRVRSTRADRFDTVQRNRDWRFSESIRLGLAGDLVDPNFIRWDSSLKIGLLQEHYDERFNGVSRSDGETGLLLEYDLSLDVLPTKPVSLHAYARSARDRVPRRFLPSLLDERREAGVSLHVTHGIWTGEVGFEWSDVDRTGSRRDLDDEHLTRSRFFTDHRWTFRDGHSLRIAFDHEREESEYQGSLTSFDTRRDQLRIEHDLAFGAQQRHRLDTYFRWNNEQGDLARDELEFVPRLTFKHSDKFQTIYRYSYYRLEQDAIEIRRHKVDLQAVYRPDDRLRISGDLYGLHEQVEDDVETYEAGGSVDASWRSPTSRGTFLANAAFTFDRQRTSGSVNDRPVFAEARTLDPTRPTFLRNADVHRLSIRVFNATRTRLYIEGTDYLVYVVGRRTYLTRRLSGRIVDGETVLVDYRFRIPLGSRVDSYRADLRLEHEFTGGLTPYYAFEIRRQYADGSRGTPVFTDNTERHRFGMRFDQPDWSVTGEVELFNDSIEPYDAFQFTTRATLARTAGYTLDAAAQASYYDYKGDFDPRNVWWVELDLRNEMRLSPTLAAQLNTAYRWEDNSRDGETSAVDLECGLQYQRGYLTVELTVEYDLLRIRDNRDEGFGVWLNVRRDLSHLFASSRKVRR